jgi:hypothetical protein
MAVETKSLQNPGRGRHVVRVGVLTHGRCPLSPGAALTTQRGTPSFCSAAQHLNGWFSSSPFRRDIQACRQSEAAC